MNDLVAQLWQEPIIPPTQAVLTTWATLNWIAFQQAEDKDLTLRQEFVKVWGFPPAGELGGEAFRFAVSEAAGTLRPGDHERLAQFDKPPRDLVHARARVAATLMNKKQTATALQEFYQFFSRCCQHRLARFRQASASLIDTLATGRMAAVAMRAQAAESYCGVHGPQPIGQALEIPSLYFLTEGVSITQWGAISAPTDVGYLSAKFRTKEVLAIWPGPSSAPVTASDLACPTIQAQVKRKRYGGGYAVSDTPLVHRMRQMVLSGEARSPHQAAQFLADQAPGSTHGDSKAKRLLKKYLDLFSSVQN